MLGQRPVIFQADDVQAAILRGKIVLQLVQLLHHRMIDQPRLRQVNDDVLGVFQTGGESKVRLRLSLALKSGDSLWRTKPRFVFGETRPRL